MSKLSVLLFLALISFSNLTLADITSLECTEPNIEKWKSYHRIGGTEDLNAIRTLTFDLLKEGVEWQEERTYISKRKKGTKETVILNAKLTVFPGRLLIERQRGEKVCNSIEINRKDLTYVRTFHLGSMLLQTPSGSKVTCASRRTKEGSCKVIEIDTSENIL